MKQIQAIILFLILNGIYFINASAQEPKKGKVVTAHIISAILKENKIGLDTNRSISVYLPPGYEQSKKSYPVIYFFHSLGWSNEKMFAGENSPQPLLDRAINNGTIRDFILVAANYSSPTLGSWFENSSTSGKWIDFTIKELLPYIDSHYRTIRHHNSRGLAGEFIGGYGALKFAMLYPDLFSVVYALHPVGTGSGLMPGQQMVNWERIYKASSFSELWGDDYYAPGFVAMSQAYLPNPNRPPFYCDFIVEKQNGKPTLHVNNLKTLESRFHLDKLLRQYEDNLRKIRAIAFDWGRYDRTQSHVYSNQAFTRTLDQLGIEHIAEEYNGDQSEKNWIPHGRVEDNLLPFFNRYLVFGDNK
jgi:hypothetical protein